MEPFKKFFQTRPISKTLLLVGIILTAIGYGIEIGYGTELGGLVGAGIALIVGAALVAIFTEG